MKTVASAAQEIVRPRLRQIVHVPPSPRYVGDEFAVVAVLVIRFLHLQHVVVMLVEHEICTVGETLEGEE